MDGVKFQCHKHDTVLSSVKEPGYRLNNSLFAYFLTFVMLKIITCGWIINLYCIAIGPCLKKKNTLREVLHLSLQSVRCDWVGHRFSDFRSGHGILKSGNG